MPHKVKVSLAEDIPAAPKKFVVTCNLSNTEFGDHCENWDDIKNALRPELGKHRPFHIFVDTAEMGQIVKHNLLTLTKEYVYCTVLQNRMSAVQYPLYEVDTNLEINSWILKPNILSYQYNYINPHKMFTDVLRQQMLYETHRAICMLEEAGITVMSANSCFECSVQNRMVSYINILKVHVKFSTQNRNVREAAVTTGAVALALKPLNHVFRGVKVYFGYNAFVIELTSEERTLP